MGQEHAALVIPVNRQEFATLGFPVVIQEYAVILLSDKDICTTLVIPVIRQIRSTTLVPLGKMDTGVVSKFSGYF